MTEDPAAARATVRIIAADTAPRHRGPVPQAVEAGGWLYVSAVFGADPTSHSIPADARAEADQLFANLGAILAAAGSDRSRVVRVGIVMRNLQRDRPVFNDAWRDWFGDFRPARSAIEAADFGRVGEHPRYMIEATAFQG